MSLLHRQLPASDEQLLTRQRQLASLGVARALWEVLDAELSEAAEWGDSCKAELEGLLEETSTDDTRLVSTLEVGADLPLPAVC